MNTTFARALRVLVAALTGSICALTPNVSLAQWPNVLEAKAIAEEGFIYGLPIVMNYAVMYEYAVDRNSGQFKAPFNQIKNEARVYTYGFVAASTENASAVVYCQYFEYPAGCVVRPGVVVAQTHDVRKIPPSIGAPTRGFILRQDLFDRNDPNNLRSDYHGPPAQPGQF